MAKKAVMSALERKEKGQAKWYVRGLYGESILVVSLRFFVYGNDSDTTSVLPTPYLSSGIGCDQRK